MRWRTALGGLAVLLLGVGAAVLWLARPGDVAAVPSVTGQPAVETPDRPRVRTPRPETADLPASDEPIVDAPQTATLVVRVVAAPGAAPLADARVVLNPDGATPVVQQTDASGSTRFADLEEGDVTVHAFADRYVRSGVDATLQAGETTTVEARLSRGVAVVGTVREARTERVIAGATVVVSPGGAVRGAMMMRVEAAYAYGGAVTDDRGRYRVGGIESGEIVTVRASAAGHAPASQSVILEPDATVPREVDLHLAPAGVVRGTVRLPDGAPAAGAQVFVFPADAPDSMRVNPTITSSSTDGKSHRALRVQAGEDGAYSVGGLELDAAYVVLAVLEGHGRTGVHEGVIATALEPEATEDMIVVPPPSLLVRVTDPDGRPQIGGYLSLFGDGFPVELTAGESGEFTTTEAVPGQHTLRVTCPGTVIQEIPVELVAGESQELEVRLDAGLSLSGVLVDDAGTPIAGQTIVIGRHWTDADKYPMSSARTTTDDEGRFHVSGLCAGPHGVILVLGRHDLPDAFRLEPPGDDVRIVVMRRAALRARLHLPSGSTAPKQVAVRISHIEGGCEAESGHSYPWNRGELVIDDLPVQATHVRIQVPGHVDVERDVKPRAGGSIDLGHITVERGFDLTGRVLDGAGGPIAGAQVSSGMIWTPSHQVVGTDSDGRFTLRAITERFALVLFEAEGFLPLSAGISLPHSDEWVVRLDAGCLLTVHVTDAAKKPSAGTNVRLTPIAEDGSDVENGADVVESDHRGLAEVRLAAGRWRAAALDDEYEPLVSTEIDVVEGGSDEVWLTLPR